MSQRRASHHNRCLNCRVNNYFCVCHHLIPIEISARLSLIVHVSELKLTSNTAQFVKKVLPNNTEIFIRGGVEEFFNPEKIVQTPGRALFLFPDENSLELNEEFKASHPGPYHLIVPDGSWTQAKKVKKRERGFDSTPTVRLPSGLKANYRLRQAPREDWVSTLEAVAYALGILEDETIQKHLLAFFSKWVEATLAARSGDFSQVRDRI
jgi:DTW domain-containing protein